MKEHVAVVLSTYNGSTNIARQLDSIFAQQDVSVSVFIRDDCSSDNTVEVIEAYKARTHCALTLVRGENMGYARSFLAALCQAPEAEYYAFSDQDDVWSPDKLCKCIRAMTGDRDVPQLAYCRMTRTDPDLRPLDEQVPVLRPEQLSKKLVLTQTYNYGAATVLNAAARELVCRHVPENPEVPHDAWAGLLCYWFGKVRFVDESLYSWIRYDGSVTGAGTQRSGMRYRLRETLRGKTYYNVSSDLLGHYRDLLSAEDEAFLLRLQNYRHSAKEKWKLLADRDFRRSGKAGTVLLKLGVLTGRF